MAEIIPDQKESQEIDPKKTGTEFNSHMTNDGAPGSHSALFGLGKDGKSDSGSESKKQPGDVLVEQDKGTGTGSDPTPAQPEAKTAGMADGTSNNSLPGAGSTHATPEQGSGKVGEST